MDVNQLITEVVVKDTASAVADRITDAMERMADAEGKVDDQVVKSTRSLESAAATLERYRAAADPAYGAAQKLADSYEKAAKASTLLYGDTRAADAILAQQRAQQQAAQQAELAAKALQDEQRAMAALNAETASFVARYNPLAAAQQRYADTIAQANRLMQAGKISILEYDAALAAEEAVLNQTATAARRLGAATGSSFSNMGFAIQNAGFQIGDFAVQVASGGGIMRPLIQQGTQLISMFGPWGAVIGAAGAVVGALATSLTGTEKAANDASKAVDTYAESLSAADDIAKRLKDDNQGTIDALQAERRYRLGVADAAIAEAQAKIQLAKANVQQSLTQDAATADFTGGVDTTGGMVQREAQQKLDQINAVEKEIIDKQRQIAAELRYGGENMDPFSKMGQDFSSDYYSPKKPAANSNRKAETKDIDDERQAVSDLISKLQDENALLKTTGAAHDELTRQRQIASAVAEGQAAAEKDYQAGLRDTEILTQQELQSIKDTAAANYDLQKAHEAAGEAAKQAAKDAAALAATQKKAGQELANFLGQSFDRIGQAVTQFTVEGGNAFKSLGNIGMAVLAELEQEFIKLAILNPLKNMLTGGNESTLSSVLGGLVGAASSYGMGSLNTSTGMLGHAANGGYIEVGENGPEKFYPSVSGVVVPTGTSLTRDSARSSGAGGGVTVQYIDQRKSGTVETEQTTGPNNEVMIRAYIRDVVNQGLGGGAFDGVLNSNFAVGRKATTRRG